MQSSPASKIGVLVYLLLSVALLQGQDIPLDVVNPANLFIRQELIRGRVKHLDWGTTPYTWREARRVFQTLLNQSPNKADNFETRLIKRFATDFGWNAWAPGMEGPWRKSAWSRVFNSLNFHKAWALQEPHLVTYSGEKMHFWADWRESFWLEASDGQTRPFYWDRLRIGGYWEPGLSFYSDFLEYRLSQTMGRELPLPPEYKQGFTLKIDSLPWLVWDRSYAGIVYRTKRMAFSLEKRPLRWGFSPWNPVILSGEPLAYTYVSFQAVYKGFRFQNIQGALLPFNPSRQDTIVPYKRLAAHRFEWDIAPSTTLSFTELMIYARRFLEPGYLLPVNIYMPEEHNLGDRDNLLMALEARWRGRPGLEFYGTFLWDELNWLELLKPWWGNKFIFQVGSWYVAPDLHWDLGAEFTAARPWVFTHNDSLITFTSGGHSLGYRYGPNSRNLMLFGDVWLGEQGLWHWQIQRLQKGQGLGSHATDNYDDRNRELDENTPSLMPPWTTTISLENRVQYRLTRSLSLLVQMTNELNGHHYSGRIGFYFDW